VESTRDAVEGLLLMNVMGGCRAECAAPRRVFSE
jgi:hypothetical protein